jgi:oxepin-CoA hydrolase / 3-oxo-5,6-dehydrosuberyl-CoA semialdehyde dehydrogenase
VRVAQHFVLQLIADSSGDLLKDLMEQKLVGFTGSASTAARRKAHPNLIVNSSCTGS